VYELYYETYNIFGALVLRIYMTDLFIICLVGGPGKKLKV